MRKHEAQELYLLVNTKADMDALLFYVALRIEDAKERLMLATDMETVHKLQGSINELKRFYTLREEVNNPKD